MIGDQIVAVDVLIDPEKVIDQKYIKKRQKWDHRKQDEKTVCGLRAGNGDEDQGKDPQNHQDDPVSAHSFTPAGSL